MSEILNQIAQRVREIRDDSGFTIEEAAKNLGIPLETYTHYENADQDIPISMLY